MSQNQFIDYFSNTLLGTIMGRRSRNNKYIFQPDFFHAPFSLKAREQWVTVNGNETFIYNTTGPLKIVIDRMALLLSNGVWQHLDRNGEVIQDSPWVALLENPNLLQSRNEFLQQWYMQRAIYGNIFMYQPISSALQTVPSSLWNLAPSKMTIHRTGKIYDQTEIEGIIDHYTFKMDGNGQDINYETENIIQFSLPDVDDPVLGRTPLESIRMEISNIRLAMGYRNVIMSKKGGLGVWSSDSRDSQGAIKLTEEEEIALAQQLVRNYGIGDHQEAIAISRSAVKFTPATFPTKELMLFEEVDEDLMKIIDLYGGNKNMFTAGKDSTFNNVEMGERQAYQNTIIPIADDLANGLAKRWGLLDAGESLKLDYSHLPVMQKDQVRESQTVERRARAAQILMAEGMPFTPEEVKEITGLTTES